MNDYVKRTWAEVNLDNIAYNTQQIMAKLRPGCQLLGVVKADAYGHGDKYVAECLRKQGVKWFGVSNLSEALALRKYGIKEDILIFGITPVEYTSILAFSSITQAVFSAEYAHKLSKAAQEKGVSVKVHIKLDTGMGRIGFSTLDGIEETADLVEEAVKLPGLIAEGIFTHFAVSDEAKEESVQYTREQFGRFMAVCQEMEQRGVTFALRHCCNSGAFLSYPEMQLDMVRPGNLIYGLYPSSDCEKERKIDLRPAMTLRSMVSMVKTIGEGRSVSYGRNYRSTEERVVATVPIGYADGYTRRLTNRARVLVHGQYAPQIGNVCMDQMMIDVTGIPGVQEGDIVTLFGEQDGAVLPVEELAELTGTINYEVVSVLGRRVPRIYLEDGKECAVVDYVLGVNV